MPAYKAYNSLFHDRYFCYLYISNKTAYAQSLDMRSSEAQLNVTAAKLMREAGSHMFVDF